MSEIKREPTHGKLGDLETVVFDEDHTLSDFVRYLLTQTDRDELRYLVDNVEAVGRH